MSAQSISSPEVQEDRTDSIRTLEEIQDWWEEERECRSKSSHTKVAKGKEKGSRGRKGCKGCCCWSGSPGEAESP